jgi:hypothetical protein
MNIKLWLKLALPLMVLTAFTGLATAQQKSERSPWHPPSPTCRMDAAGMCGGTCPKGQVCQKKGPGVCGCEQEVPTCALIPGTKMCGGPCPNPKLVCQKVDGQADKPCQCLPPTQVSTCGYNEAKICGGTCIGPDQGKVCRKDSAGVCGCKPAT